MQIFNASIDPENIEKAITKLTYYLRNPLLDMLFVKSFGLPNSIAEFAVCSGDEYGMMRQNSKEQNSR